MARTPKPPKSAASSSVAVEALRHREAKRKHIPTAEMEALVADAEGAPTPVQVRAPREPGEAAKARNPDLDPQLVWRGKETQDADGLTVDAVPVYIQEKIHPQAIIDDLRRRSAAARREREQQEKDYVPDLFSDFNGLPEDKEAEIEFYEHDANWTNRMILGDSLLVMTSLAEKEALKGQVQCIYFDPPYGIKFNSNWQPSTKTRDVQDGKVAHMSREPEMVRAFRDTWKEGIHSYLAYLRDRLIVARDLLTESGSIFVQIGDENVHLVRALMDEVFGRDNFISMITFVTTSSFSSSFLSSVENYVLWFGKDRSAAKFRPLFDIRKPGIDEAGRYSRIEEADGTRRFMTSDERQDPDKIAPDARVYRNDNIFSQGRAKEPQPYRFGGIVFDPWKKNSHWKASHPEGIARLDKASRLTLPSKNSISYVRYQKDSMVLPKSNIWTDTQTGAFTDEKLYVVQTNAKVIERCILMASDPGDLVLDPTCGSGTTAYVAEQWGRRWITVDTSRVALALARQRLMSGRFASYLLQDSEEGAHREAELTGKPPKEGPFGRSIRQGLVYERVPHIMLKDIANNAEIDVIWEKHQAVLDPLRDKLNAALDQAWEEWEVPRELGADWSAEAKRLHGEWWEGRRARQAEIDASIARNAETEYLYDRPYEDKSKIRVTGPFTVESLSPHRILAPDEDDDEILQALEEDASDAGKPLPPRTRSARRPDETARGEDDFVRVVLDNLKKAGVQNTKKGEKLVFTELKPWSGGHFLHLEGHYEEAGKDRRVAVFIGPEYGTVSKGMVRRAAKEAMDSAFHTLIVCGFAFEPQVNEDSLSRFPGLTVLKARMNADLHMSDELRNTGAGNLFVVFGEPDIAVRDVGGGKAEVEIMGVDIFDPTTGEVRSSSLDDIACWFVDTDYDGQSFFVRHAYFLGGNDPYKKLKTTLKAEIDEDAWATLYSAVSRPFEKPSSRRIAVKVINHYGDEVMKVYDVP
ncbi:site-specific DNA-methyltransferase [Caenispirillum salinarum]|uniref:site-specific DNA-methyltransferase n=1 Tax=Caenispirillum salinarum TaxID=859058 RepID=UPI00384F4D54